MSPGKLWVLGIASLNGVVPSAQANQNKRDPAAGPTLNEAADLAADVPSGSTVGRLEAEIRRELALIDSAVREDTLKPFSNNDFDQAATAMKAFAPARITYVKCEVERLTTNPSRSCG